MKTTRSEVSVSILKVASHSGAVRSCLTHGMILRASNMFPIFQGPVFLFYSEQYLTTIRAESLQERAMASSVSHFSSL